MMLQAFFGPAVCWCCKAIIKYAYKEKLIYKEDSRVISENTWMNAAPTKIRVWQITNSLWKSWQHIMDS